MVGGDRRKRPGRAPTMYPARPLARHTGITTQEHSMAFFIYLVIVSIIIGLICPQR